MIKADHIGLALVQVAPPLAKEVLHLKKNRQHRELKFTLELSVETMKCQPSRLLPCHMDSVLESPDFTRVTKNSWIQRLRWPVG
jgi:hypothetical protein